MLKKGNFVLKKSKIFISITFIFLFGLASCIEEIEWQYDLDRSVLVVDATLTDENTQQSVSLQLSKPDKNSSTYEQVVGASVSILVDEKTEVKLNPNTTDIGRYFAPKGFKAELGKKYTLKITMPNGEKYTSDAQTMTKGGEISKAYQNFKIIGKPGEKNYKPYHEVYLDTKDPAGKGNFYSWSWRLFEKQEICRTCNPQERYYPNPFPGVCIKDLPNFLSRVVYDYQCSGDCWEIIHSTKNKIFSDEFSDGNEIKAVLIAEVPLYQFNAGSVIEIKQQSINFDNYRYYKQLIDQTQNSGSLADTPPSSLIGNIRSDDGKGLPVAGIFNVVDESLLYYFVARDDIFGKEVKSIPLLGRETVLEPVGADTTRPPRAPCINGYSRTNIAPPGWRSAK